MLHGSPGNSQMLLEEIAAAAPHFTCFALDTPGFGDSDALPGEQLKVSDLASATAEAMLALGLPPCPVYGTHTGAAIGIELGIGWPERTTGLVLEGLPIFTDAEIAELFTGYFQSMIADPLGGHLTSTWIRFRDQFIWFPWTSRNVRRRNPVDRPTPEEIHHWVMMFYRSCKSYQPAYKAACYYGQGAYRAAEALQLPCVYMASAEDMLFPHLDRLPALKAGQRIERLPYDAAAKHQSIVRFLRELATASSATITTSGAPAGDNPAVQFVDGPDGQIFIRCYGKPTQPAIMLLHDAPGTGLAMSTLAQQLAEQHYVIVPDLPGNGESESPSESRPILEAAADAAQSVASVLNLHSFTIGAVGCGCVVAAILSSRSDARITAMVLDSVPALNETTAQHIAPALPLSAEGAHWLRAWLMIRDSQIYKPWFDGRIASQLSTQGNFDANWLHDQTFALMKSRTSYHRLPQAAYRFDTQAALSSSRTPIHIAADGDLQQRLIELSQLKHTGKQ